MEFVQQLWLPMVLSAVGVFVASAIIWMATPLHKKDYVAPVDEDGLRGALRGWGPGKYFVPWAGGENCKEGMKSPEYQAKLKEGPWALVNVMGSAPSFGKCLGQWFALQVVLAFCIAYAASAMTPIGAGAPLTAETPNFMKVFQIVGAIALLAHVGAVPQDSIWRGARWSRTVVQMFDGVVYALLTAAIFAWLWPRGGVV